MTTDNPAWFAWVTLRPDGRWALVPAGAPFFDGPPMLAETRATAEAFGSAAVAYGLAVRQPVHLLRFEASGPPIESYGE